MNGGIVYLRDDFSKVMFESMFAGLSNFEYNGAYDYLSQVAKTGKLVVANSTVMLSNGLQVNMSSSFTLQKQFLETASLDAINLTVGQSAFVVNKSEPNKVQIQRVGG